MEVEQMQKLLNTLYITEPDVSLRLKGEALTVIHRDGTKDHIPLHQLEQIVSFSYGSATLPLLTAFMPLDPPASSCARRGCASHFRCAYASSRK